MMDGTLNRLPPETVSRIRSTFIIASLSQALEELVANSLDAGSTNIIVSLDVAQCTLTCEDDGCGMSAQGAFDSPHSTCPRSIKFK